MVTVAWLAGCGPPVPPARPVIAATPPARPDMARERQLVVEALEVASPNWVAQRRASFRVANERAGFAPTPPQLEAQLSAAQQQRLDVLYREMLERGGPTIVEHCRAVVDATMTNEPLRRLALAVLQRHAPEDPRSVAAPAAAADPWTKQVVVSAPPTTAPSVSVVDGAAAIVAEMRVPFRKCYQAQLSLTPNMAPISISIVAIVPVEGGVGSVTTTAPPEAGPEFVQCLEGVVSGGAFQPPGPDETSVTIPITFVKDKSKSASGD
jgi:hypothetical protein